MEGRDYEDLSILNVAMAQVCEEINVKMDKWCENINYRYMRKICGVDDV